MIPAKLAPGAAFLGGVLWIVHALLGGGSEPLAATLHFVGLACILVAAAAFGTTLVKSDAVAMRVVVGLASGLLALALIEAFRVTDSAWYDGFWGIVAALLGGIALLRGRGQSPGRPRHGAHSR
jgi:hypothetical protein